MDIKEIINNIDEKAYYSRANLHCHSNYSDGEENFENLITQAQELGLKHFSITDHNSIEGYLKNDYKKHDFLIAGVEFDCFSDFIFFHILGYGIDPNNEDLKKLCSTNKKETSADITRLFYSRNPKKVIDAIHSAGGIAVLAHPCCYWAISLEHFIKKLQKMGLDGVETYYPYERFRALVKFHSRKKPLKIAQKLNLLKTGGNDCHTNLKGE